MRDMLVRGFVAGVFSGILTDIISCAGVFFNISELHFIHWAGFVLFGSKPVGVFDTEVAFITHLIFAGILGVIFSYIMFAIETGRTYLFRGWIYGMLVWFFIYSITLMAKIPGLQNLTPANALIDMISASVYGVLLAFFLRLLDQKAEEPV